VLVHAFSKKTQQLKKKDIDMAEKRMEDLGIRQLQGEINHLATWKIYRTLMPS
jgi:hypothetical protein